MPPIWRDLYASGQKLLRQGVDAGELPGRLWIRPERLQEICGACSVRVVALGLTWINGNLTGLSENKERMPSNDRQ